MRVCVLGSSSSGNCTLVATSNEVVLVDLGLAVTRVERCLKELSLLAQKTTILLTHAHHDHISGVESFCRRYPKTKVICHQSCYISLLAKLPINVQLNTVEEDFYVGEFTISPFVVKHDVPCVGYSILHSGKKVSVATDLGEVNKAVLSKITDSDLVVLESNHDEELVRNNKTYSEQLKKRILSCSGHLSNRACANSVVELAQNGVKQVILAHLSKENNYPELAYETCRLRLQEQGLTTQIEVASADKMSKVFLIA